MDRCNECGPQFPLIAVLTHFHCSPLHLVETVNAYSETHPDLSLMACYIAADMLRELLKQGLREAETDA